MSLLLSAGNPGAAVPSPLYRAVWRWHFYAGLLVIPFLLNLAFTGGLYLFKDELNDLIYGRYLHVAAASDRATGTLCHRRARALKANPGAATSYLPPANATASAVVSVATRIRGPDAASM